MKIIQARCTICLMLIPLNEKPFVGQRVTCPICHNEYEVVGLSPIRLKWTGEEDILEDPSYSFRRTPPKDQRFW